jgi:hypothetical protein
MLEYCSPNGVTVHKCSLSQIFGKFHIPQLDATHPAAKLLDDAVARDDLVDHSGAGTLDGNLRRAAMAESISRAGLARITHEGQSVRRW